uniref:GSVIVT01024619001 n=1 Tax=Arundo donax TaxID=35708 RepID=A0A0A9EHE6_ARUDO
MAPGVVVKALHLPCLSTGHVLKDGWYSMFHKGRIGPTEDSSIETHTVIFLIHQYRLQRSCRIS